MKHLPNMVTVSRILFGVGVYVFAVEGRWIMALICLTGGWTSDALDGYLAIKLNARTKIGEVLDPISDFIFIVAIVTGLIFSGAISWKTVAWLTGTGIAIFLPIIFGKKSNRLRLACEGLHSFYAFAIVASCIMLYLFKAGGSITLPLIATAIAIPISIKVVKIKRHRVNFFLGQISGKIKENQPHLKIFPIRFIKKTD
jgi:phosphatidylglycerophosphate synthase